VPSNWVNPSGDYRLGKKALFELCSGPLRERLRRERKEKLWQPNNTEYIAKIQKKLVELKSNLNNKTTAKSEKSDTALVSSIANDDDQAKNSEEFLNTLLREDLDSQLEVLKDLDSKVKDVGPIYDCIVWNDGNKWQACIDTTENGQLDTCKVLTNYRESQEYGTFSFADMLNYSVRILHQDNILEIVTDSGLVLIRSTI
jgi:tripeptidyl-peptidase-2